MKIITLVLLLSLALITGSIIAQVPQGIPYQAVARDLQGQPLASRAVKVRFSVLDSTATGTAVYVETHATATTALGLFAVNVGMGTPVTGTFSGINWGVNSKFLKVELDTTSSGNNYVDLGTQQMMSVPYAFYSGLSNLSNGVTSRPKFSRAFSISGTAATQGQVVLVVPPGKKWCASYSYNIYPVSMGGGIWGTWWVDEGDSIFYIQSGVGNYAATFEEYEYLPFQIKNFKTDDYNIKSSSQQYCVPQNKYWKLVSFLDYNLFIITNGVYTTPVNPFVGNQNLRKEIILSSGQCIEIPQYSGYSCVLEFDL